MTQNTEQKIKDTLHIVIDLETASKDSNAAIVAIGAAGFTLEGGDFPLSYFSTIELSSMEAGGAHICRETLEWWGRQDVNIRDEMFGGHRKAREVLLEFYDWVQDLKNIYESVRIWGYGADFDNVILANAMDRFDVKVPWTYRESRCARTLLALQPPESKIVQPDVTKHHALVDAQFESVNLRATLKYLESRGVYLNGI